LFLGVEAADVVLRVVAGACLAVLVLTLAVGVSGLVPLKALVVLAISIIIDEDATGYLSPT
jgi:hypothetical protein